MLVKVTTRAPKIVCHKCKGEVIASACHHDGCQRFFCQQCAPSSAPKSIVRRLLLRNKTEFTRLGVAELSPDKTEIGSHCHEHRHREQLSLISRIGLFILLVGLLYGLYQLILSGTFDSWWIEVLVGYFVVLFGPSIVLAPSFVSFVRRRWRSASTLPPLPIVGHNYKIKVAEMIRGTASLDQAGQYSVITGPPTGQLEFSLQFTSDDRKRVKKYHKKYGVDPYRFDAGFALLHDAENLVFADREENGMLRLRERLENHPFFQGESDHHWSHKVRYSIALKNKTATGLPIQIFPTLMSAGDKAWGIALRVQTTPQFQQKLSRPPQVKELLLEVPSQLGDIESRSPSANFLYIFREGSLNHGVRWADVELKQPDGDYAGTFYARFDSSADHEPEQITIRGHLHVEFDGTLSGLSKISLFNALGYVRSFAAVPKRKTEIAVSFEFDLKGLCLRKLIDSTCRLEKCELIPDSEAIVKLVNALAENDMYIKRVLENPPQMSRADAQKLNRFWVIIGRKYYGVFPIDFRIVVSGRVCYGDSDDDISGQTNFEVTAHAIVTNDDMVDKVEELKDTLAGTIRDVVSEDAARRMAEEDAQQLADFLFGSGDGNR